MRFRWFFQMWSYLFSAQLLEYRFGILKWNFLMVREFEKNNYQKIFIHLGENCHFRKMFGFFSKKWKNRDFSRFSRFRKIMIFIDFPLIFEISKNTENLENSNFLKIFSFLPKIIISFWFLYRCPKFQFCKYAPLMFLCHSSESQALGIKN